MTLLTDYGTNEFTAGCDEAGRGCLAGPVFAASVILPVGYNPEGLNDSKKLSPTQRELLRAEILDKAVAWAVAKCDLNEIDRLNILWASIEAMHKSLGLLNPQPQFILVDGNKFKKYKNLNHKCIVGGDGKFACIAAASILAKTFRDDYMNQIGSEFPQYGWDKNKGYGTASHMKALKAHGPSKHHRKSFKPIKQFQFDL